MPKHLKRSSDSIVGDVIQYQTFLQVDINDSLETVIKRMRTVKKYAAVVTDKQGKAIGLITAYKLLTNAFGRCDENGIWGHVSLTSYKNLKAGDVMIMNPTCIEYDCPADVGLQVMQRHDYSFVPVTRNGKTIGIADINDLFSKQYRHLQNTVKDQGQMIACLMGYDSYGGASKIAV